MVTYAAHLQSRVMFEMTDQPQPTNQSILLEKGIFVSGRYRDFGAQIVLSLTKYFGFPPCFCSLYTNITLKQRLIKALKPYYLPINLIIFTYK